METKMSTYEKNATEGTLRGFYTINGWFVKVKPALAIDKMVFSFVDKSKKNKSFDVYMDPLILYKWCKEMENEKFFAYIAKEKEAGEKYPKRYQYVTGNNGAKSVGFSYSTSGNGYVINGKNTVDGKSQFANVPIDFWNVKALADLIITVIEENHWIERFCSTVVNTSNENASRFHANEEDEECGSYEESAPASANTSQNTSNTSKAPAETKPKEETREVPSYSSTATNEASTSTQTAQKQQAATASTPHTVVKAQFKSTTEIKEIKSGYCMKAVTEEGDEYHIIFTKDVVAQIPEWAQFEKNASKAGMVFSCSGAFVEGKFYVKMMP